MLCARGKKIIDVARTEEKDCRCCRHEGKKLQMLHARRRKLKEKFVDVVRTKEEKIVNVARTREKVVDVAHTKEEKGL